ncbi:DUF4838 domain-containing protein [Flavobacterium salilacus subsp. salilacus]|uniref:DUF4838 domain-containing protein n=1 Tax=Flavobacterium TaxID=237 RepID=UPI001074FFB0|nr:MULTISPECIES: DUF4838 domain-containing protein [Flavobacterium]KAF2516312.1 DUF4838 domain-containing protein [Flavobacterium salilacus subsp. salilacus]MBE1613843.1 DUF4838 domain-containing protein [Flavobacterium sp. SaA2.13]
MIKKLVIVLVILVSFGCDSNSQTYTVYEKNAVEPVILINDTALRPIAEDLCDFFEQTAGMRPVITDKISSKNVPVIAIDILKKTDDNSAFTITHKKNTITIKGIDIEALYNVNRYFFANYTAVNQFSVKTTDTITKINIPINLDYKRTNDFEYREPYFPDNFSKQFRRWNATQTLEEEWALWGHNIGKVIKVTPAMLAKVDGEVNEEQLCFSSPELETALKQYIKKQIKENQEQDKFMIMPNDNAVVCRCDRCEAVGNTKTNASPAVFSLLNKLAKSFTEHHFFSTAYITTQQPPSFKLEPNAGVMISTMAFPKGVVMETSDKKDVVKTTFDKWKNVTGKIYLWDYAINFDNYFEFYPTVSTAQQNLQFYKNLGVTGVFMQGSEDRYSAFSDLKCYLYALLLQDVELNINKEIAFFFSNKYPDAVSTLLTDYYTKIENLSLKSVRTMDIYGGISASKKKYLNESGFEPFYDRLIKTTDTLNDAETKMTEPLLLAFTFQKLEILRTSPNLDDTGYATVTNDSIVKLKPEVNQLLERLKKLKATTGIDIYNESGYMLSDYIHYWEKQIIGKTYKNRLFGKKVQVLSELDEDYPDSRMLTDGAVGFNDYYNNWLLVTGDTLSVQVTAADVKGSTEVEMNFLNDSKHKIYLPQRVEVIIDGRKYEAEIKETKSAICKVVIPVIIKPEDKKIIVNVVKQPQYANKSIACDELYFK